MALGSSSWELLSWSATRGRGHTENGMSLLKPRNCSPVTHLLQRAHPSLYFPNSCTNWDQCSHVWACGDHSYVKYFRCFTGTFWINFLCTYPVIYAVIASFMCFKFATVYKELLKKSSRPCRHTCYSVYLRRTDKASAHSYQNLAGKDARIFLLDFLNRI